MRKLGRVTALAAAVALAGCATNSGIDVTRFHLNQPIPADTIELVPSPGVDGNGLEFRNHAAVVANDLAVHGFRPPMRPGVSAYIGVLRAEQTSQFRQGNSSPFTLGVGAGTGGSNFRVGGNVQVPVGGSGNNMVQVNMLSLQMRRRSESTTVWEGRAVEQVQGNAQGTLTGAVPRLSRALLKDFPGPSGQTVRVQPTR
jgi:hypothetical protein